MKAKLLMSVKPNGWCKNTGYRREDGVKAATWRYSVEFVSTICLLPHIISFSFCYQCRSTAGLVKYVQETGSLCKVFLDGEQSQNHGNQLNLGSTVTASANHIDPTRSIVPNSDNSIGQSSRSQPQVCQPSWPSCLMAWVWFCSFIRY